MLSHLMYDTIRSDNPWTFAAGDADELRDIAQMMDKIRDSILSAYKEKTGLSEDKLIETK